MSKKHDKKMVPEIRFPEFEGEWEEKKLGDLGEMIGGGTPSKNNKNFWNGHLPWISSSDVFEEDIHSLRIERFITEEGLKESATKIVPPNSIIIVSRVGVGKVVVNKIAVCTSQDFTNLVLKRDYPIFFAYLIKVKSRILLSYNQGTSIKGFVKSDLKSLQLSIPVYAEQQKIASFLSDIDTKIEKLSRKKELMEQYKKGMMQKLFSREIRFKPALSGVEGDENGEDFPEWEEKKLGDVGVFKNGLNKDKQDFGFGTPFVNLLDVFDTITLTNSDFGKVNATKSEIDNYDLQEGDILFIRSSVKRTGVGKTVVVIENLENTVYSGFLIRFRERGTNSISIGYKKYCFDSMDFRKKLLSYATTSANTNINQESFESMQILIPSFPEQEKIADFLTDLDSRINRMDKEISVMKEYKLGLLQKMFV